MTFWDTLDPKYRLLLCDIWGVVHDGVSLYPGATERLTQWREQGRCVVLVTNAPRTAEAVKEQLTKIGLPAETYDGVATSGEAGIVALLALGIPVGFIGTRGDRAILAGRGVQIAQENDFTDLACTGVTGKKPRPEDYRAELEGLAARSVRMHCLNPDRMVIRGGVPEACAGAIADLYAMLGGDVTWYGKPHEAIYRHALKLAGDPPKDEVLAVGDALQTDMLGAAQMGFDAVFVTSGIHSGEPFPVDFGARNGLPGWEPVAIVDGLA